MQKKINPPLSLKVDDFSESEYACDSTEQSRKLSFECEEELKCMEKTSLFDDYVNHNEEV